jgi:Tfp pilus assembly protein FimT
MRKQLNPAGFTVVELLVVLVVTTLLVLVITGFMIKNLQQSTLATARGNILRETEQSLDLVANDVRLSANADANNRWADINSPSGATNQWSWQSDDSTLVLATAAEDNNGAVIFSDSKNYITEKNNIVYFVKDGTLYKRTIASTVANNSATTSCPIASASASCPADKELLHNVTGFTVTYKDGQNDSVTATDARSIELGVTVSKHLYSQDISVDYKTRMVFRND